MADTIRHSQNVIEILSITVAPIRESQTVVEILFPTIIPIRESQNAVEILSDITATIRSAQDVIEILSSPFDLSGIYYINPNKTTRYDSYYSIDKKTPDPTIRTGLIGD